MTWVGTHPQSVCESLVSSLRRLFEPHPTLVIMVNVTFLQKNSWFLLFYTFMAANT